MIGHVLITGGCGFIGSALVRFVLAYRPAWRVTNLDALTYSGNPANLAGHVEGAEEAGRYRFVRGDIRDRSLVERLVRGCDAVVNLAAESHVDRSIADARPFVETNVLGTQTLLDATRGAAPPPRFLQVSTDEVYGSLPLDRPDLRFAEDAPLRPRNPYAASKAAADLLVLAAAHTFALDARIIRLSNNFGPYQFPEKIIPLFVTNLLRGEPVPLYGDGRHVRDWLHVDDAAEAIVAALERGRAGEAYNAGGHNERSNGELTRALLRLTGRDESLVRRVPDRPGHDLRYALDTAKIERELGWRPTRSAWPEALEQTVRWYAEHAAWWAGRRA